MMTAIELVTELRRRGVELVPAGDRIRFRPKEAVTPELRAALVALKAEVLRLLAPSPSPRYAPGCLYDFIPGRRVRPVLWCVSHQGCPRQVVLWRDGLLAEMFGLEKLVGQARRDGETEWTARGQGRAR